MIETNTMAMQANFIIMIVGCLVAHLDRRRYCPRHDLLRSQAFLAQRVPSPAPCHLRHHRGIHRQRLDHSGHHGRRRRHGHRRWFGYPARHRRRSSGHRRLLRRQALPPLRQPNLAAGVAGTKLFDHVRHMLYSTIPSFLIAVSIFAVIGSRYSADSVDTSQIDVILSTLEASFNITPLIFIAPLSVILMIVFKVPAIPGMLGGTVIGFCFALAQGNPLGGILQPDDIRLTALQWKRNGGCPPEPRRHAVHDVHHLLVICALAFGGAVKATGCLDTIIAAILKRCHSRGSIMTVTCSPASP